MNTLLEMSPDAFERLCQRLLRESGFIQVEVTVGVPATGHRWLRRSAPGRFAELSGYLSMQTLSEHHICRRREGLPWSHGLQSG